jgi:hypothetical protein
MKRAVAAVAALGVTGVGAAVWLSASSNSQSLPQVEFNTGKSSAPAMCPWRAPARDIQNLFPAAGPSATYRTDTLALSRIREKVLRRLGPGARLENNSLYVHRVLVGGAAMGSVIVRRVAGPHGAIEVVTGIDPAGKISGILIQRHRETAESGRLLTSDAWLASFRNKSAESSFEIDSRTGEGTGASAAVTKAVRSVLIELREADTYYKVKPTPHH